MMIQAISTAADAPHGGDPSATAPVLPGKGQAASPPAVPAHANTELRRALDALFQRLDSSRTELNFRVDHALNQVVISIVDPDTGAVLRQIPGEEVLRMAQSLQEYLGGLVDEKA